MIDVLLYT
jgi:hypothetical protein